RDVDGQEFPRGRESPRAAVAGDQQEHGDGLHLPEEEEQQVVERDEDAVDPGLQHQQQGQVFLWLLADPAGRQNGEEEQEGAEEQGGERGRRGGRRRDCFEERHPGLQPASTMLTAPRAATPAKRPISSSRFRTCANQLRGSPAKAALSAIRSVAPSTTWLST